MPLIKGSHSFDDHFTQIPNAWVRDSRLSLKARGLLAQLMSHTAGWSVSISSLAKTNNCGVRSIRGAVDELIEFGYLARSDEQGRDDQGNFADYTYTTQDPPDYNVLARLRFAHTRTAHAQNDTPKNTINKNTKDKKERELGELFDEFWSIYPKKDDKPAGRRAFTKALDRVSFEMIIEGAKTYRDDPNREKAYTKNASTWLNNDAWDNEPIAPKTRRGEAISRAQANVARLRELEKGAK